MTEARIEGTTRWQATRVAPGGARATLLNALGDLVYPVDDRVPTAGLVRVLEEVGYAHHAARQAVSRCARAGWIAGAREGRVSRWSLTRSGRELIDDGIRRVEELGTEFTSWDGRWFVLVISIPQEVRAVRPRLYRTLEWGGFGSPLSGIWVSPHCNRRERILGAIERMGLRGSTVSFFGTPNGIGLAETDLITRSWDLEALGARYENLVRHFSELSPRTDEETLRCLLALDGELQPLPSVDPRLPTVIAPEWSGRKHAARLLEFRARWLPAARAYWSTLRD